MNQDNFKSTLAKKLTMDFEKGKLEVGKDFAEVCKAMQESGIVIDFTDNEAEANTKAAVLRLQVPSTYVDNFAKFKTLIFEEAKDLFGVRDGYIIGDVQFEDLVIPS